MGKHFGIQNIRKIANGFIGKGINDFYEFALSFYDVPVFQIVFDHFGIATNLAVQLIGFL